MGDHTYSDCVKDANEEYDRTSEELHRNPPKICTRELPIIGVCVWEEVDRAELKRQLEHAEDLRKARIADCDKKEKAQAKAAGKATKFE